MNKYHNSKIYTIRSHLNDKYYIGSTTQPLYKRLYEHKISYQYYKKNNKKYMTSFEVLKFDDAYIELLEEFSCNNKN
jgi:hypothetical protein